jgi:GNAT superfamily N-acetyltransferase
MIREAALADVPQIVELGVRFMRESGYAKHLSIDRHAQAKLAVRLIKAVEGLILVDDHDGELVGMLGVIATFHPHSGDPVMAELFWYVLPDARGNGVRMLQEAEHWAIRHGVKKSLVVAPEGAPVASLYTRMGYKPLERQFIKDLL